MPIVLASQAIVDAIARNNLSDCLHTIGESALVSKFSSKPCATSLAVTILAVWTGFEARDVKTTLTPSSIGFRKILYHQSETVLLKSVSDV